MSPTSHGCSNAGCDRMISFTLLDRQAGTSMVVEMDDMDKVSDVCEIISDCWSCGRFVLRNGYTILDEDESVSDCIDDGDIIHVVPDPDAFTHPSLY